MNYTEVIKIFEDGLKMRELIPHLVPAYETAISAIQELQMYKDNKLCLIPEDVYGKQCEELDRYKELGTLEEVREAMQELQKIKCKEETKDCERDLEEAIERSKDIANKKYAESMIYRANPNDDELFICIEYAKGHEKLSKWLEELKEYKQIGTLEEVREAMKKQKPKLKHSREIIEEERLQNFIDVISIGLAETDWNGEYEDAGKMISVKKVLDTFRENERKEAITCIRPNSPYSRTIISAIEKVIEYEKLGNLKEVRDAVRFKEYFDKLYGEGLEVANWHLNGDLEPFDNFYNGAIDWIDEE